MYDQWPVREDGACVFLTADNKCEIYNSRPPICQIDKAKPVGMPEALWVRLNARACNVLQRDYGISEEFRVPEE